MRTSLVLKPEKKKHIKKKGESTSSYPREDFSNINGSEEGILKPKLNHKLRHR